MSPLRNFAIKFLVVSTIIGVSATVFGQDAQPGKVDYDSLCAGCHGTNGRGDGPFSEQLRSKPSDLTMIAKSNDGVFPTAVIYQIIDGRRTLRAHQAHTMPVWGNRAPSVRILAIIDYLKTIQVK